MGQGGMGCGCRGVLEQGVWGVAVEGVLEQSEKEAVAGACLFTTHNQLLHCSSKPKCSICLLVKLADAAFWLCTAE